MNLRTFIERPVLSAVISITIVVVGIIGLFTLPVEQYPDIAPPTIMVSTSYFGASAETLQKSVIAPLEEAINGVEDMTYMTSSATNAGTVSITVYFKQGTDPDMAAVNVQNRVSKATGQPLGGKPSRCHHFEAADEYPANVLAPQPGRLVRRSLPGQLYQHQPQT